MQQSFASTENASGVADACLQHGIRVQKPMIADAGARPAMSRTIANANTLRCIRSIQTDAAAKTFRECVESMEKHRHPEHVRHLRPIILRVVKPLHINAFFRFASELDRNGGVAAVADGHHFSGLAAAN